MGGEIGKEFMAGTRYRAMGPPDQSRGRAAPPLEMPLGPTEDIVQIPQPGKFAVAPLDLSLAIERRQSLREYRPEPLSLEELSYLLWCTQGVKQVLGAQATRRTVPSAGARHAFETFLLINRVETLHPGLYRFLAIEHKLARLPAPADVADRAVEACLGQDFVATGAATFMWVADVYRMTWRYGQRGYRYLHLDAGHVCQNLYLAAEAVDCGACGIGAFDDHKVNALLGLDGQKHFAIYLAAVGKKP
ncbi:MAG: nitroreductase [Phycisphaerae bacterium SM23_33]|jgi:SagB-type dehydrogenase family enzyme|nr:MAG: nitroreductase [Phycisphaerae bacterium SM23_33]